MSSSSRRRRSSSSQSIGSSDSKEEKKDPPNLIPSHIQEARLMLIFINLYISTYNTRASSEYKQTVDEWKEYTKKWTINKMEMYDQPSLMCQIHETVQHMSKLLDIQTHILGGSGTVTASTGVGLLALVGITNPILLIPSTYYFFSGLITEDDYQIIDRLKKRIPVLINEIQGGKQEIKTNTNECGVGGFLCLFVIVLFLSLLIR